MTSGSPLSWEIVEAQIHKEIALLDSNIFETKISSNADGHPITCRDCLLRQISILIVQGHVRAREISSPNLWIPQNESPSALLRKHHGKDWHFDMMNKIASYFSSDGYIVEPEPKMNYGTGDLYVVKKGERPVFVEVGTVLLYKLLYNISTMIDSDILVVPRDNYVIEFSVLRLSYPYFHTSHV